MAVRKATIQQQVAESIYRQNPTDRPIVTVMGLSGPSPLMLALITTVWMLFVKAYFITVTEQAVLVQRASKWTSRPQEILHVIPRGQAPYLISDVQPRTLWSFFRLTLPGAEKPSRVNVHRMWKHDMEHLMQVLYTPAPQGGLIPPQQSYAAPPFPPQAPPVPQHNPYGR